MILVDANILVFAATRTSAHHRAAHEWLDDQLNGDGPVGLPWGSLLAFLRIITNPRIASPSLPMADALKQTSEWLGVAQVWIPAPTERHGEVLGRLLTLPGTHSNLVPDAHLAALAIEHGLTLCSTDGDFARFPGLRWANPLTS